MNVFLQATERDHQCDRWLTLIAALPFERQSYPHRPFGAIHTGVLRHRLHGQQGTNGSR